MSVSETSVSLVRQGLTRKSSSNATASRVTFFSLPGEIRNQIMNLVFEDYRIVYDAFHSPDIILAQESEQSHDSTNYVQLRLHTTKHYNAVTLVSKRFYADYRKMLIENTTLVLKYAVNRKVHLALDHLIGAVYQNIRRLELYKMSVREPQWTKLPRLPKLEKVILFGWLMATRRESLRNASPAEEQDPVFSLFRGDKPPARIEKAILKIMHCEALVGLFSWIPNATQIVLEFRLVLRVSYIPVNESSVGQAGASAPSYASWYQTISYDVKSGRTHRTPPAEYHIGIGWY